MKLPGKILRPEDETGGSLHNWPQTLAKRQTSARRS